MKQSSIATWYTFPDWLRSSILYQWVSFHYVPSAVNRSAVMDSIHDSLRYVHGGGPIPSTVTGHKSGSVKTVPVMCHTSYCHGFWAIDLVYWFFCLIRHSSLRALKGVTSPIHQSFSGWWYPLLSLARQPRRGPVVWPSVCTTDS